MASKTKMALLGAALAVVSLSASARPAVVELYTSEGCSSCPPAEKLLEQLASRSDVLALAFHVDYWDGLGWRDRFSMQEATQRQKEMAELLKLTTVGTPQLVVEGRTAIWGASPGPLEHALKAPRTDVGVQITRKGSELTVRGAAPASGKAYDVYVAGFLPKAVTEIKRGENAGRTLTEVNVVRYIRKVGSSADANREWNIRLDTLPKDAARFAILLQEQGTGAIVGAVQATTAES